MHFISELAKRFRTSPQKSDGMCAEILAAMQQVGRDLERHMHGERERETIEKYS